jgi:hypothetical protein
VPIIACPQAHRAKAKTSVQLLGADIRLAHLEKHLVRAAGREGRESRLQQGPGDSPTSALRRDGQVEHLAAAGHVARDQVAKQLVVTAGGPEPEAPRRLERLAEGRLTPGIAEAPALELLEARGISRERWQDSTGDVRG